MFYQQKRETNSDSMIFNIIDKLMIIFCMQNFENCEEKQIPI